MGLRGTNAFRVSVVVTTVIVCMSVTASAMAAVFTVNNLHGPGVLVGIAPFTDGIDGSCYGEDWANPNLTPSHNTLPALAPGQVGSFLLINSVDPFFSDPCEPHQDGSYLTIKGYLNNRGGSWAFVADDPEVGKSSVPECVVSPDLAGYMSYSINQPLLTCSFYYATGTPRASFVASLVAVGRKGVAFVPVQMFAKRRALGYPFRNRLEVVLRRNGQVVGRGQQRLGVGAPRIVRVPLKRSIVQMIRKSRSHQVTVKGTLTWITRNHRTADRLTLILQGDHPNLRLSLP